VYCYNPAIKTAHPTLHTQLWGAWTLDEDKKSRNKVIFF